MEIDGETQFMRISHLFCEGLSVSVESTRFPKRLSIEFCVGVCLGSFYPRG